MEKETTNTAIIQEDVINELEDLRMHDSEEIQQISDEMANKMKSGSIMKELGEPIFTSIIDGILELRIFHGFTRRLGLNSKRLLDDCRNFSYEKDSVNLVWMDGYTELKNEQDLEHFYERMVTQDYDRANYEDKASMNRYKAKKIIGKKRIIDEYTGKGNLYPERNNSPRNYKDPKWRKVAETDHIMPLKKIHEKYRDNYALGDDDIKRIANEDYNYAMTAAEINDGRGKGQMTNEEYLNYCKDKGIPVPEEQAKRMLDLQKIAEKKIENGVNKSVARNIIGKIDKKYIETKYEEILQKRINDYEKKHGCPPSKEKMESIIKRTEEEKRVETKMSKLQQQIKQKVIVETAISNSAKQVGMQLLGNVLLFMIKPLYYEVNDIVRNGLCEGVGTEKGKEALSIRFGRIKNYVIDHLKSIKELSFDVLQILKDFLLAIIEGFINMFVGLLRQILKVVKEGAKVLVQSWKVLFGEESKNKTAAEKADAIIKLLGGSVAALCGVGIDYLLSKIPLLPEDIRRVLSTMFGGIASALVMYSLDRIDMFNIKGEKRNARMKELDFLYVQLTQVNSALALSSSIVTGNNVLKTMTFADNSFIEMGGKSKRIKQNLEDGEKVIHEAGTRAEDVSVRISALLEEEDKE